jgi:hypothetical protein
VVTVLKSVFCHYTNKNDVANKFQPIFTTSNQ